jgi:hypothetical protein
MYLSIYQSMYVCIYLCASLCMYLSIYIYISNVSIYLTSLSIYVSIYLSMYLSIYLSNIIYIYTVSPATTPDVIKEKKIQKDIESKQNIHNNIGIISIYLSNISIYLTIYLYQSTSNYLPIYPSIHYLSIHLSINLQVLR